MSLIRIEVDEDTAKQLLNDVQKRIADAVSQREKLDTQITGLNDSAKRIREQIADANGKNGHSPTRQPAGENQRKIVSYLNGLPNKKAKPKAIATATGISLSTIYYTISNSKGALAVKGGLCETTL